jgi:hypothetical protein
MKKPISIVLMAVILTGVSAVTIEFKDDLKVKCEIVGKKNDTLFVTHCNKLYKLNKEDIRYINTQNWSGNQKEIFFEKKDWIVTSINPDSAKGFQIESTDYPDMVRPGTLKNIDEMNDREFQIYLAQTQAQAIKDSSKKITRNMWIITLINIALGITIAVMK